MKSRNTFVVEFLAAVDAYIAKFPNLEAVRKTFNSRNS